MWKDWPYFHSCFCSHCGEKKKGAKPWDRGKRVCFLKCRKCLSCNLNVQLINFEFSGSKVLSWRAALFPHCGSNMTPWSKCRVWHMRQKRGLSYCTEGQRISKVPWKYVFGKILLRETAASIRATVLKESVKSFRQRNTLGFCKHSLRYGFLSRGVAILQCIELTSAVEEQ